MMMNRVILIGRLTQEPALRHTNAGTAVASFTLAVDRASTNQSGKRETDFMNIVVWQKQAENCAKYLHKGRLAAVDGRLQIRSYDNQQGQKVRVAEIVAESVRFLDRSESSSQSSATSSEGQRTTTPTKPIPSTYDDDPFADDTPLDFNEDPFAS